MVEIMENMELKTGKKVDRIDTIADVLKKQEDDDDDEEEKESDFMGNPKVFNDPIHGNIHLNPVCLAIIDTPQFQRLRYLKQLGLVYFVYPGAAHNRFEHSLGVCYLAGQYVQSLRDNQPELGITKQDILCVEIAGLCHDLGHGPFSHMFDQMFIPTVKPGSKWTHETASLNMFDHIVDVNKLSKEGGIFEKYGLSKTDLIFIKELIAPQILAQNGKLWPYKGRTKSKAYLYEIVANKRNNIDVDKWDYMARDCHQLGIKNNFDHKRFIKFAKVLEVGGELQICLRDKESLNLYNLFSTRYTLHKVAYQHPVASSMAIMMAHALIKANEHISITGSNGVQYKISDCINNMAAYTYLTDNIIFKILDNPSDHIEMKAAKELIGRLLGRDLYKCIFQSKPIDPSNLKERSEKRIRQQILDNAGNSINKEDFYIEVICLDFGMKDKNPVEKLNVYSKFKPNEGKSLVKEEASRILAANYAELIIRVYSCKKRKGITTEPENVDNKNELIKACQKWIREAVQQQKTTEN